jgi:DNA ligase D-like protein (predicted 3'-phosphoesterase)
VPGRRREDPLAAYRAKRDPTRTAEPVPPEGSPLPRGDGDTFVVQEHHTPRGRSGERVHWDLRLERDGVLKSWAVPKGPPTAPGPSRLAVPTEDHPLEYASFEGPIAAGEPGGGEVLAWDGEDLLGLPYAQRRDRLDALALGGHRWASTPWFRGGGAAVLAASRDNGLEGVVAKRLDSPYRPGVRGPDWRKVKNVRTQAVVVGGWRPGQGRRAGGVGSLLVGLHDDEGRFVYAGHVGTGFTAQALRDLEPLFTPRRTSPFPGTLPREVTRDAHWVEPELVGEVAFAVWTTDGRMRHPSWRGLRDDLAPEDVVEEW